MEVINSIIEETVEAFTPLISKVIKKASPKISLPDLEDIEQEVKIKIWKQLTKSETEIKNINSYIWKVTYNATCNILGKRYKEKWISFDEAQMEQVLVNEDFENKSDISLDQEYDREKLMRILEDSIDTIIDSRRQVLKLYVIGMSKKEIAKYLGWTVDKVRNLLYRGIKDLKIILEKRDVRSFF